MKVKFSFLATAKLLLLRVNGNTLGIERKLLAENCPYLNIEEKPLENSKFNSSILAKYFVLNHNK